MLACFFIAFYMFASCRDAAHYRSDDAGACRFFFAYFLLLLKQKRELRSFLLCLIPLYCRNKDRGLRSFLLCLIPLFATTK